MKDLWKTILKDKQITQLYKDINNHINYVIDHGMPHTLNVLKYVDMICKVVCADEKTTALSRIAALLHDSGRLKSRSEHAKYGAIYASEYLQGKLSEADKQTICYAIEHHDRELFDFNSTNDVAYILIMADKMDYTRDRYIPALLEEWHKEKDSYNIKSISLNKVNSNECEMVFELFKPIKNFYENFCNIEIYKKVLQHFGFNVKMIVKLI